MLSWSNPCESETTRLKIENDPSNISLDFEALPAIAVTFMASGCSCSTQELKEGSLVHAVTWLGES